MSAKQVKKVKKAAKSKPKKKVANKASAKKSSAKKVSSKKSTAKKAVKKAAPKAAAKKSTKKTTTKKVKAKKASTTKTTKKKSTAPKKETSKKQVNKKKEASKSSKKVTTPAKSEAIIATPKKPKPSKKKVLTSTHKNLVKKATPEIKPARKSRKSRYTETELDYFNKLIDKKLIEAREQLEFYLTQIKNIGSDPDNKLKGLEDGTSTSENEKAYALAARQRKYIHHLENAKLRIKNKVYGVCRVTGNLISKARLKAVPHATLSIGAKLNS